MRLQALLSPMPAATAPASARVFAGVAPSSRREQQFDLFEAQRACGLPAQARFGDEVGDEVGEMNRWPRRATDSTPSGGKAARASIVRRWVSSSRARWPAQHAKKPRALSRSSAAYNAS